MKLVIDNTKKSSTPKTCVNDCSMYDPITQECGIWKEVEVENPSIFARCQKKQPLSQEPMKQRGLKNIKFTLIEDDFSCEFDDQEVFYHLQGEKVSDEGSTYPFKPDFPSNRGDAIWFIDSSQTYGCWIVNHSKNKFISLPQDNTAQKGVSSRIYKSPYPLHDHKSSKSLASRMCWYVNEDGYGPVSYTHLTLPTK